MNTTILFLALTLLAGGAAGKKTTVRPPHPLAPSVPLLSEEEYAKIDKIIDRFILYDTGKLRGVEGRQALQDFLDLGPEAVFPLIDGFNRAANLQHSCPAVLIAKKLSRILGASQDLDLLDFARENIGAGVTVQRHRGVIKDLQLGCMLRRTAVHRAQALAILPGYQKPLRSMSVADLAGAADREKGPALKVVLLELDKRPGPKVLDTLALAVAKSNKDVQPLARTLLARNLSRLNAAKLKTRLQDERPEVRLAAVSVIAMRKLAWGVELIERLGDEDDQVVQGARRALIQLAGGADHGPEAGASTTDRLASASRWREWWSQRSSKVTR